MKMQEEKENKREKGSRYRGPNPTVNANNKVKSGGVDPGSSPLLSRRERSTFMSCCGLAWKWRLEPVGGSVEKVCIILCTVKRNLTFYFVIQ